MTNLQDAILFKRIVQRNVSLPLAICALLCAIFVGLVFNLILVSKWVDHTNEVINRSSDTFRLILDTETSFRGYLITGNDQFLEPY
jgi:CHASE3 domain sensor protein